LSEAEEELRAKPEALLRLFGARIYPIESFQKPSQSLFTLISITIHLEVFSSQCTEVEAQCQLGLATLLKGCTIL